MNCKDCDLLMSLKLDGALSAEGERELQEHMANCNDCGPLWQAMMEADKMLAEWVLERVPVPQGFHAKVMERIAVSTVERPRSLFEAGKQAPVAVVASSAPVAVAVPAQGPIPSPGTRPLTLTTPLPTQLTAYLQGWQARMAMSMRAIAVAGLSMLGAVGLLAVLLVTGVVKLEGPFADAAQSIGSFLQSAAGWARDLFAGIGPEVWIAGTFVLGLLVLVGWQVVASYHRSVREQRGNTGYLEVAA